MRSGLSPCDPVTYQKRFVLRVVKFIFQEPVVAAPAV
jgi:hypothetical protein